MPLWNHACGPPARLQGETLRDVVLHAKAGRRPYSDATALSLLRDVTEALAALHAASPPAIHRDVKAENILLKREGLTPAAAGAGGGCAASSLPAVASGGGEGQEQPYQQLTARVADLGLHVVSWGSPAARKGLQALYDRCLYCWTGHRRFRRLIYVDG